MKNSLLEKEFIRVIQQNERVIYKVASFYADTETPLSDLYQEVVLNLWKGYPSFRGDSKTSTWIYRIALNTCITFFRKKKNKPAHTEISFDIASEQTNNDDLKQLYYLINQLGKLERALVLLYLDEKSYQEMADITGLSLSNVATKLSRIKNKLKQMSDKLN